MTFGSNVSTLRVNVAMLRVNIATLREHIMMFPRVLNYVFGENYLSIENSLIEGPHFSKSIVGFSSYLSVVALILEPKNTTNEH